MLSITRTSRDYWRWALRSDEYDGESSLLESEMAKVTNFGEKSVRAEQVQEMLSRIWNDQFGPFDDDELIKRSSAFAAVSRKLVEA